MYLVRGNIYRKRALKLKIRHRTAVRYPMFVGWHNLEMLADPPKDHHRHNVTVRPFRRNLEFYCMLCVPPPLMFAHQSSAFGGNAPRLGRPSLEKAMIQYTTMSFVRFSQAAEYNVADSIMRGRLWVLAESGRLCANGGVLVPLSCKLRGNVL